MAAAWLCLRLYAVRDIPDSSSEHVRLLFPLSLSPLSLSLSLSL